MSNSYEINESGATQRAVMYPRDIHWETGFSFSFIYKLLRDGEIKGAIKIGDRYLVSRKNFEKWINGE
jgi:excisionase family DNA binding protein